ncbi:MAG: hypothetical protein SNJ75_00635 [Gemmataceae bacterium]
MSSRRFTGLCALLLVAWGAPLALGQARAAPLPCPLLLTVHPATYLPIDFTPRPGTPPAEELDRLEKTRRGPAVSGLLDLLDTLDEVPQLAPARRHTIRFVIDLMQQLALVRDLFTKARFKVEFRKDAERRSALELSFSRRADWSELAACYADRMNQFLQYLDRDAGQTRVAHLYLQAAHKALEAGDISKATQLVQLAHQWKPAVVEADPLAFKLQMHASSKSGPSGEEATEPARLPIHPRQYSSAVMRLRAWSLEVMGSEQLYTARKILRSSLASSAVPLTAPADFENGMAWMGFTVTGRPTFTLMVRCPETGSNWVVHVGNGTLPVVWMLPQR